MPDGCCETGARLYWHAAYCHHSSNRLLYKEALFIDHIIHHVHENYPSRLWTMDLKSGLVYLPIFSYQSSRVSILRVMKKEIFTVFFLSRPQKLYKIILKNYSLLIISLVLIFFYILLNFHSSYACLVFINLALGSATLNAL